MHSNKLHGAFGTVVSGAVFMPEPEPYSTPRYSGQYRRDAPRKTSVLSRLCIARLAPLLYLELSFPLVNLPSLP